MVLIKKKNTNVTKDQDWFTFSMGLSLHLFSDYLQMKLCYMMEPLTLAPSNFVNMVEVVEKSLKVYLALKSENENTLSYFSQQYGHNLEKMREDALKYNQIFSSNDIKSFTSPFNDNSGQLYQKLRYGAQRNIDGFSTRLSTLLPVVEKIFYFCIQDHDEIKARMLNNSSILLFIITENGFDQSQNRQLLLDAIKYKNEFYITYEAYCKRLKEENDKMQELLKKKDGAI